MLPTNRANPAAIYSSPQSTETINKSSDEILFETLMKDPIKKAFLLNILSQEKENIQRYKQREGIVNKTPVRMQPRTYCESPTALLRRRALQGNRDSTSSSTHSPSTPSSPVDVGELLKGVVAYVEIRSKGEDRSAGAKMLMQSMGASVVDILNRKVTHVVFKDGSFGTYQKAKLLKVHFVSVLWLEAVRKSNIRVPERDYPALGTDSYDINVSALYQEYENVVRDEQRRSLATSSQRSAFASQKRSRLTMLPSDFQMTNRESFHPISRMLDIVRSSQEYETESIISFKGPISIERPDSAILSGRSEENVEMTSDDDSEVGMINGHSMSQVRDSSILDLDAQLSEHQEPDRSNSTINRISKSLSTPSESLLSRKSLSKTNDMTVDMELTANRVCVVASDEGSTRSNGSRQSCRSLPVPQVTLQSITRRTKSSETMPSLRISADSVPTQLNMPPLRISETESETRRTRSSSDMPPLQLSTENLSELDNNADSASSTKRRSTKKTSQVVNSSQSSTKRKLSDRLDENNVSSDVNKSGSVDDGNPLSQTKSVGSKKLRRKLFNLNQVIDSATQSQEVVDTQPHPIPATKILVVPLPRMSFDTNTGLAKPAENLVVFPIRKKRRYPANKKLRNGLKSVKKICTNAERTKENPVSTQQFNNNVEPSQSAPNRRHSIRIENAKFHRTEQSNEEEIATTSEDQREIPAKRRCTIKINASQSHISSQLRNRRSTFEFLANSSAKTQRSQKSKTSKPSIVCSRLHRPDVQVFMQIVRKLGVFFFEDEVSKKTTHLVIGECKRTVNLLKAICRGCWILRHEWLLLSLEAGAWLPEEDYELTEFSPAVQQCRRERQVFGKLYCMEIFTDCGAIYVSRNSSPRRSDLEELIRLCNGTVAKEVYHAKIIVGDWIRSDKITCVNEKWVLDSITLNRKKSFKNYLFSFSK